MYRTLTRTAAMAALTLTLGACGAVDAVSEATDSAKSKAATDAASSVPTSTSASPSSSGDAPIGGGSIDLGGSATSYPAEKLSRPGATDCYSAGSRIYDRHGVTCAEAITYVTRYSAMAASAKGSEARVGDLTCSHNPAVMVGQGAAPAKCVDDAGSVVLNWRYPGAPPVSR